MEEIENDKLEAEYKVAKCVETYKRSDINSVIYTLQEDSGDGRFGSTYQNPSMGDIVFAYINKLESQNTQLLETVESLREEKEEYKLVLYMVEPNLEDALQDAVTTILNKWEKVGE